MIHLDANLENRGQEHQNGIDVGHPLVFLGLGGRIDRVQDAPVVRISARLYLKMKNTLEEKRPGIIEGDTAERQGEISAMVEGE